MKQRYQQLFLGKAAQEAISRIENSVLSAWSDSPTPRSFVVPTTEPNTGGAAEDHQMHRLCFTAEQVTITAENK